MLVSIGVVNSGETQRSPFQKGEACTGPCAQGDGRRAGAAGPTASGTASGGGGRRPPQPRPRRAGEGSCFAPCRIRHLGSDFQIALPFASAVMFCICLRLASASKQ